MSTNIGAQAPDFTLKDGDGLLRRGLVVRLLVLPNDVAGVREAVEWVRRELSPRGAVSLVGPEYATNKEGTDPR